MVPLLQRDMDPTLLLFPMANFVACLLILLSSSKNIFQSWNVGACSFAVWVAVMNFQRSISLILWSNSIENIAPVWCDIGEDYFAHIMVDFN